MRRGRPKKPTISVESVEAALRTLGHRGSEVPEVLALQQLAIVDVYLKNPARPLAEDIRGWALRTLLTEIITDALSEQRAVFDLAAASIREKRHTAPERIQTDSQSNSSELLGWSILFYRYVRSDLELTVQELADFATVHPRTIRRERHTAILRLRDRLIQAEWEARQTNHLRLLRASIPEKHPHLIERDSEMDSVIHSFEHRQIRHIFITGAAGIGKSAFAAAIANWLIEQQTLDYIVWLSQPKTSREVQHAVIDKLLPYQSRAEIASMLLEYQTLVVIDGAEALIMKSKEWLELLQFLNHAIVIICNREHILFSHPVVHIPIQELSQFGIYELIATYDLDKFRMQKEIIQVVGGNPRAIDFAIRQLNLGNRIQFGNDALRALYHDLFYQIDDSQQFLWILLATQRNAIHNDEFSEMVKSEIKLFDYAVMDKQDNDRFLRLLPSARAYIELIVEEDAHINKFATEQISNLLNTLSQAVSDAFLDILDCNWLEIEAEVSLNALAKFDTSVLLIPQLRRWWGLIQNYDKHLPTQRLLLKGVAARRLQKFDEAFSIFHSIIETTGKEGDFRLQSSARYELAVLHQIRADFDRADQIYQELESYSGFNSDKLFAEKIRRQQARMAIESRNPEKALAYLELFQNTVENGILLCEAYLLQKKTTICRNKARQYLNQVADDRTLSASLYTIIGRSYEIDQEIDRALEYFNAALALTERFSTAFDIARAKSNLASAYLHIEDKELLNRAEELLHEARSTQKLIQDTVGILVTERNLQQLHKLRLNR